MTTQTQPEERSVEDLENEIATLSAAIQAATHQLIVLVGEMDRRDGWADPLDPNGFRSCAHWLSFRTGLSLPVARQYVRIARKLPDLPLVSEAFSKGELSYSKVRAITRIAEPDNEEQVLEFARAGTASHVEKLVRRYRKANVERETERAVEQQQSRHLVTYYDNDGMLAVRGRLAPEQGALFLKALEVSTDELRDSQNGSAEPSPAIEDAECSGDQMRADALARLAERALACDAAESSSTDRYQVVVHVDAEVLADPSSDGRCELEDGPALAPETVRRLACNASVSFLAHGPNGELTPGRKTRVISSPLRRALRSRDGTGCVFPGCTCRGRDAHHIESWAAGGPTVLENLVSLCRAHHTFVHEGGFGVEVLPEGGVRFIRPDGQELLPAPSVAASRDGSAEPSLVEWLPEDIEIGPMTGKPTWDGEQVDYEWVLMTLQ